MKSLLLVIISVVFAVFAESEKVLICYYGSWATYRYGLGKFDVSTINPELCTHIVYAFVGINNDGHVISVDPYLDLPDNWGRDNFGDFNALKQNYPHLKTLLAVGGYNEGSAKYSTMVSNPALRQNFITSARNMLLTHSFDGLDIDWEYPGQRDTVHGSADIENFTQLLKELKEEFQRYGLLVTVAVAAVEKSAMLSYDVIGVSENVDYIHLMTYDFHGSWDGVTGHNAGLFRGEGDDALDRRLEYTVDAAVQYWLEQGAPASKLVLGLPLYGRTFTLTSASNYGVRAPSSGAGIAGPYTQTNGIIGYNELCVEIKNSNWLLFYDDFAKVPYAVSDNNWASYDDTSSLRLKVEYAMKYGLAGAMVWSIETDDFHALCHDEDFPLLRAINRALGRKNIGSSTQGPSTTSSTTADSSTSSITTNPVTTTAASSTITADSSTTTTTGSVTSTTGSVNLTTGSVTSTTSPVSLTTAPVTSTTAYPSSICTREGFVPSPTDCSSFYRCLLIDDGSLVPVLFKCPKNLYWDHDMMTCNYSDDVSCEV